MVAWSDLTPVNALQVPVRAVPKTAQLTTANTPVKLMDANIRRAYFALSNDQVTFTLMSGAPNYTLFDPLYFCFDQPITANTATGFLGMYLMPGLFEPSLFGGVSQQEVWVWSPLTLGARIIVALEGVYDPAFTGQ